MLKTLGMAALGAALLLSPGAQASDMDRQLGAKALPRDPVSQTGPIVRPEVRTDGLQLRHVVTGTQARLNRRVMGEARRFVQGVPSEPVDSFVWSGVGSTPIEGSIHIDLNTMNSTGEVTAKWTDRNGDWVLTMTRFTHPDHHSSGVRLSSSMNFVDTVLNEAISHNVYLHGNTGAGQPVAPTVFTYVAAWGPATVTLNGEEFANPFEIPAPQWSTHLMVTEGIRRSDGSVRNTFGGIYNPSYAAEGAVEPGDIEIHLTFHDDVFPQTSNIPPIYSFFYHVIFEEVEINILQGAPD